MKFFYLTLALLFASTFPSFSQDAPKYEQYQNIKPEFKCRFKRKDMSFCKVFPHFAFKKKLCNPMPELLGHIEWCREDVTITDRDDCGNFETYEAVVITYRKVYCNGAWGDKFKRTYRKEATIITPPLAKNVIK
ncbi:MAG: hypothetical protein MI807_11085 [Verrucomicrobiales bacterium]|nr:hypothetical protein [Verrucomicrobiales bacterium]